MDQVVFYLLIDGFLWTGERPHVHSYGGGHTETAADSSERKDCFPSLQKYSALVPFLGFKWLLYTENGNYRYFFFFANILVTGFIIIVRF